jgi:hypothetical protein
MRPLGLLRAFGIAAVAAGTLLGLRMARTDRPVEAAQQRLQPRAYEVGDRLPVLSGVDYSRSEQTVAIYLSTSCYYCIRSMEFYRALANEVDRSRGRLQLVVVGWETAEKLHWFVRQYQLKADRVVSLSQPDRRVFGTPTLVLANRHGVVRHVWVGEQPPAARRAILSLLGADAG